MLYSCITIMRVIVLLNSVLQTLEETNSVQSNFWSSPISMAVPDCCRVRCWNRSLYMDDECLSSFCLNCSSNKLKLGDRYWNLQNPIFHNVFITSVWQKNASQTANVETVRSRMLAMMQVNNASSNQTLWK